MPQNGWLDFGFVLSLTKEKGFMDLNQVRYFLHLADTLNFTESARRAGVSQPSLTRAIQRLEEELGGPLLYRDGKDTRLTALGRDLQVEFMRIDHNLQQVRELAENSVNGRHRNLSIGVSTTITAHMFTKFFDMALEQLPGVQIKNAAPEPSSIPTPEPVRDQLLFVGNLSYAPNIDALDWFVLKIWPQLISRKPKLQLCVAGSLPNSKNSLALQLFGYQARVQPY